MFAVLLCFSALRYHPFTGVVAVTAGLATAETWTTGSPLRDPSMHALNHRPRTHPELRKRHTRGQARAFMMPRTASSARGALHHGEAERRSQLNPQRTAGPLNQQEKAVSREIVR